MRNRSIPLPGQDWRVCLGPDPSDRHYRQAAEADQRRLRQLRHQVGLEIRYFFLLSCKYIFCWIFSHFRIFCLLLRSF